MTYTHDSPTTSTVLDGLSAVENACFFASASSWRNRPVVDDFGCEVEPEREAAR